MKNNEHNGNRAEKVHDAKKLILQAIKHIRRLDNDSNDEGENGVGNKFKLEPHEYVVDHVVGDDTDTILFFTKKGMYYHLKLGVFNINEKQYLSNFMINDDITAAALLDTKNMDKHIVFITKKIFVTIIRMETIYHKRFIIF